MIINKMGSHHSNYGMNNQDMGFEYKHCACICDGCSEGLASEVGAKLFTKQLLEYIHRHHPRQALTIKEIKTIFESVMHCIISKGMGTFLVDMRNYLCFTIMILQEFDWGWNVSIVGDGYVITQDLNGIIQFIAINHSQTPRYLAYEYIPPEYLDNSSLTTDRYFSQTYSKADFKAIGIASDGLEYAVGNVYENDFKQLIRDRKEFKIKLLINKLNLQHANSDGFFKDDITIIMRDVHDNI